MRLDWGRHVRSGWRNLEEFDDPVQYDLEELPGAQTRIAFLVDQARRAGPRVIDLACGTGLATLPLAEAGHHCIGIDLSANMLAHARRKARDLGVGSRCRWRRADIRWASVPHRVDAVVLTGNAFQAMLEARDQRKLLANVARHLDDGGVFIFETRNPSGHDLSDVCEWEPWYECESARGELVQVGGTQRWMADRQVLVWTTERRWQDRVSGEARTHRTRIACRFTDAHRLAALLSAAGLRLERQWGDWDGSPLAPQSPLIITVCRRAGRSRPPHRRGRG